MTPKKILLKTKNVRGVDFPHSPSPTYVPLEASRGVTAGWKIFIIMLQLRDKLVITKSKVG